MPLGKGGPQTRGRNRGTSPLKRHYSIAIGSSNVKMVANRHRRAAGSTGNKLLRNVNMDDLESPK